MHAKDIITIMFVGDINLGEYYTSFGHGPRTYAKNRNPFENVLPILKSADLVIGNLEAALTNANLNTADPESMVLRGNPGDAKYLADANFKLLQVANNHTVQHGKKGFEEAVTTLSKHGIIPIGLNKQPVQVLTVGTQKIGFLAASDVPDNTDKDQDSYQRLDSNFIAHAKESVHKVDHLFVVLHWGLEASTVPLSYQRKIASDLANSGVRGIIGHHPHLFYQIWKEKGSVIAPSLGNFVFDLGWDKKMLKSGILEIRLKKESAKAFVHPVLLENNGSSPTPNGKSLEVLDTLSIYNLGEKMSLQQQKKLIYFLRNITKGNLNLKLKFITSKLLHRKHAK